MKSAACPSESHTESNIPDIKIEEPNPRERLQVQDGGLKLLFTKSADLEVVYKKLLNDPSKVITADLLVVVKILKESQKEVTKAFNTVIICIKETKKH